MESPQRTIQLLLKPGQHDGEGQRIAEAAQRHLGLHTGRVQSTALYTVRYPVTDAQLRDFATHCLQDPVLHDVALDEFRHGPDYQSYILVAKLPGVTDDEGISAQNALGDFLNEPLDTHTQHIFSKRLYFLEEALPESSLRQLAQELMGNKLIHRFETGPITQIRDYTPRPGGGAESITETVQLVGLSDEELQKLSKDNLYALNLEEMRAVRDHYTSIRDKRQAAGLPPDPTDCELEIIAQTWSEHCKHKEFAALIKYKDIDTGEAFEVDSLFKTYIKDATAEVDRQLRANGNDWLIKVFSDNAGAVRINPESLFVWKVETHNSPSAIDPYGGAITGILGNNRDPLATGIGGARLLFNTNVLCFGNPEFDGTLLSNQLHPRRIFEGVRKGIEDGGNKSGVPTVNGSIVFDDRYAGKPLVYCGTGAVMPMQLAGLDSWEKNIDAQDRIIMAGGRVGKDGIHGATFSSIELDETSPATAVQIGSPITQKLAMDFLILATRRGLIKCSTDNGAGGLSSSIGELATISGGAVVELEHVPLKYPGLRPWEIFVSESQERFSLAVEPSKLDELLALGQEMEVELTDIGYFTSDGFLDVRFDGASVARLDMEFLHDGVPRKVLEAEWQRPELREPTPPPSPPQKGGVPDDALEANISPSLLGRGWGGVEYTDILTRLLGSLNICSRESVIRQYDHEVKGRTIIKPLMGATGQAPQDAAVVRFNFESWEGVAVSNGILPRFGDLDAYHMSAGAFDEAVRQIVAVGGKLPNLRYGDGNFWSVNDNFCVPDSVYDPIGNPDGKVKLAKLVRMCQALRDATAAYCIPLTSGKDSMKNDFKADGVKISVPPTVLYSMTAKIEDVRRTVTSDFKQADDVVYLLGETYDELGGSEFYQLFGELGANVPQVRFEQAKALYKLVGEANDQNLIQSCHDLSDGGLAVALAEATFGYGFGAEVELPAGLPVHVQLFSESHSRFVATVAPEDVVAFEQHFGQRATRLGRVTPDGQLTVRQAGNTIIAASTAALRHEWTNGPVNRIIGFGHHEAAH
ncbi:phosphoribosylformylglycinamidine synthase [Hymenobacter daecheongensis DSM 21074]|uniref:Phosphoribosylformylglycinamidine synthase subunit PurL n=1 Tax=Hymenobacter daecheongensis DSM 21074 TaxID=1121955 RepID=A0A1M6L613_9BACT|nr:AIR synthase-related protein [Hymenobacter daecheongensis]SHJ66489.1 phosphoribosylformylglycinamidine synthase [Hymenobacter daecheongensis DSM 21074]